MVISLLFILGQQPLMPKEVVARFDKFIAANPKFSADITGERGKDGPSKATITVNGSPSSGKRCVDYQVVTKNGSFLYRFDGKTNLEAESSDQIYDRNTPWYVGAPLARIDEAIGFPYELSLGKLNPVFSSKLSKITLHTALIDRLQIDVTTQVGTERLIVEVDNMGKLTRFYDQQVVGPSTITRDFAVTSYRLGSKALSSAFNTDPILGYEPYSVAKSLDVLSTGQPIATLKKPAIDSVLKSGSQFVVMTDRLLPDELKVLLVKLEGKVSVVLLSTQSETVPGAKAFKVTEPDLDNLRVTACPQFYLLKAGHLVQAWQGFDAAKSSEFIDQISAALKE